MATNINIIDGVPSLSIKRGNKLNFRSADKSSYEVNFNDPDITKETLPFEVPDDGKDHKLKVKGGAKKKDYECYIYFKSKHDEEKPEKENKPKTVKKSVTPPKMIIKVE